MKHTHKAHCQACGRLQALHNEKGTIAKHGYNVDFGYFHGTCTGSDRQPLELARDFADSIVALMAREHTRLTELAEKVRTGRHDPARAKTGRMISDGYKRFEEQVPFAEATEEQQIRARNHFAILLTNEARFAKAHGEFIAQLIEKIHGQEPVAVARKEKKPVAVGDTVKVWGAEVTVLRIQDRSVRGIGPGLNGQILPHVIFEKNGKEYAYPVRLIRR